MNARKIAVTAAAVLGALGIGLAVPASAQTDYVNEEKPAVLGEDLSRNPAVAPTSTAGGSLPVTGGDLVGMALIGAGAVGTGMVLVRRSRRTIDANA